MSEIRSIAQLTKKSQFHYGSIKTVDFRLVESFEFQGLNSTMVRLKLSEKGGKTQ